MVFPLALFSGSSRNDDAPCDSGIPVRRNKLRKPQQLRKSQSSHVGNATAKEIQAQMGNHISFENIPRPTRKPRSAPHRLPSLPCIPNYETFAVAPHIETALREEKPAAERAAPAASYQRRPSSSRSPPQRDTFPAIKPSARPPACDRALHLAESYQSILPDYDMMDREEEEQGALRRQQPEHNLRQPRRYVRSLTSCADRRDIRNQVLPPARHDEVPVTPPPVPPPKSRARSMIASSVASSLTTIDGNSITTAEDVTLLSPRRRSETIPEEQPDQPDPLVDEARTFAPLEPGELPPSTDGSSSASSLALQICSELLTAELAKVLVEGSESESHSGEGQEEEPEGSHTRAAAKIQILMMIEAYEGLMEHWRDVISNYPTPSPSETMDTPGFGSSDDDSKARCARDAVAILTHWLSCLHALYRDRFGDQ